MDTLITLAAGRWVAAVSPQLGGSLLYFSLADAPAHDFVRAASPRALTEHAARLTAGYALVPYSNRIGGGRFAFDGRDIVLQPNSRISPHPIHGVGWLRAWTLVSASATRVECALRHQPAGRDDALWPWAFDAMQTWSLDAAQLSWTLTLTNRDATIMPAGIGMHPFFPKSPRMELEFAAGAVWRNDARMLPAERAAVPAEWDFARSRAVGELTVDNCFAEWSGTARITWPERGWALDLAATDALRHLVVYTTPARDSVAIEPVSHANNAVNLAHDRNDTGLVRLAPGAPLTGTMTFTPLEQ
jgi:aldose 1-epimerase